MKKSEEVIKLLLEKNFSLSVAESCTGGLLAATICSYPGVSAIFNLGVVAYSNEMKNKILKVKKRTLKKHGAVSFFVVKEMLEGLLKLSKTRFGIAISGIAGPTGGTPQKPVGTVWIGVAEAEGGYKIRKYLFKGDRSEIQKQSVEEALGLLEEMIVEFS